MKKKTYNSFLSFKGPSKLVNSMRATEVNAWDALREIETSEVLQVACGNFSG